MLTIRKLFYAPVLFLPLVATLADETKPKNTPEGRKAALEKFLPKAVKSEYKLVTANSAYLAKELAGRASLDPFLADTEKLRAKLKEILKTHKHSPSSVPVHNAGKLEAIDDLSKNQLLRIYILAEDLLKTDLPKQIGKIIDSAEESTEAGGVVLIKDGKVHFKSLQNDSEGTYSLRFIRSYRFPDDSFKEPHLFLFHTHPYIKSQGPSESSGPSWDMRGNARDGIAILGDIGVAAGMAKHYGETHHIVISTIGLPKDKTFNVNYFGGEAVNAKEPKTTLDIESRLSHIRIVNLGNYKY